MTTTQFLERKLELKQQAIEILTAENAELRDRIALLEAKNGHGKD